MHALEAPVVAPRRTELEALRGIAAMAVLVSHCWGIGHGYSAYVFGTWRGRFGLSGGQGLALFYALSGYLLTRAFVSATALDRGVDLRRYLRHRAARILPTWLLVLAFMLLVHSDGVPPSRWWRFPLLLQGFWSDTTLRVDGPAWSLAVEAQFYLLLPLLAVVLRKRLAVALAAVAVLGVASFVLTLTTVSLGSPGLVWAYSLPASFVYFVPGLLLAVLETRTDLVRRLASVPRVRLLLLGTSIPCWLAYVLFPKAAIAVSVAAGLTVCAVALPLGEDLVVGALRSRVLVAAGSLSFGVYLWHEPLIRLLHEHGVNGWLPLLAVTVPLTVVLATASSALVERPCLRMRDCTRAELRGMLAQPGANDARLAATGAGLSAVVALLAVALA